ncbi:hypothetical protein HHUSO_G5932 [Huso huso]|uniref:Uncharacterized protein n=1 Tax=Huso huso TaxID=61971 RepID=A0ABR1A260_HUSHU
MSFWFCCCFCPNEARTTSTQAERQPLMQSKSARQLRRSNPHSTANDVTQKHGRFIAKHVEVPELDQRFIDIADTFNQQAEHHQAMGGCLERLKASYQCAAGSTLADCLQRMRDEHSAFNIAVQMQGYNFSVVVKPESAPDIKLQEAQELMKNLNQASKSIAAASTKLQEMITSALHSEMEITHRVKEAKRPYQEQIRVEANLKENFQEVKRIKQLSSQYREEASSLLNEMARLAGISL